MVEALTLAVRCALVASAAAVAAVAVLDASQFIASKTTFLGVGLVRKRAPSPWAAVLGAGAEAIDPSSCQLSMVSNTTSFGGPSPLAGDSVGVERVVTILESLVRESAV